MLRYGKCLQRGKAQRAPFRGEIVCTNGAHVDNAYNMRLKAEREYHIASHLSVVLVILCIMSNSHEVWDMTLTTLQISPSCHGKILYDTSHKKLYEIHGLSASEIRSFSTVSSRISAESSKGVCGIIRGCPRNHERVSAKSYCIPRIVEGQLACSSRKGGIVVALLNVAVDRQRQHAKPNKPTYVTYLRGSWGQSYGVRTKLWSTV